MTTVPEDSVQTISTITVVQTVGSHILTGNLPEAAWRGTKKHQTCLIFVVGHQGGSVLLVINTMMVRTTTT